MGSLLDPSINGGNAKGVNPNANQLGNVLAGMTGMAVSNFATRNVLANYTIENALQGVADPIREFRFLVDFPVIRAMLSKYLPGLGQVIGKIPITEVVKSIDLPLWEITQQEVRFMGDKSHHAGRKEHDGTFSITFRDIASSASIWTLIDAWSELIYSTDPRIPGSGNSQMGKKSLYATDVIVTTLDYDGRNVVKSEIITGVWPTQKHNITKDYDNDTLVEREITFSYDKYLPLTVI